MNDIKDLEKDFALKAQNDQINQEKSELQKRIYELEKTLEEYGISEVSPLTDVEYICIKGIKDLKKIADTIGLSQDDAKTLEILHKNLRMARGNFEKKELPLKTQSVDDLIKIIEGGKK